MIKITRYLYIHILIAPMLILAYTFGSQMTFFISFCVVLIHELSHLVVAVLVGADVKSIIILPFGMTLRLSGDIVRYPKKEILIALAGPLSNAIMLAIAGLFLKNHADDLNFLLFVIINWSVLLLNLVPVPPLDGGRIMRAILIKSMGIMNSAKIIRKISRIFIALIFSLGIILLIKTRGNPSLCIIGGFLAFSLIEEKKSSDLLIMNEMIYEKEKFKNHSLIPTSTLTVSYKTPAQKVIKKLNLSTFYIIYILDDSLKIIKTATESDFIRAVKKKGYRVLSEDV